jgi:hypothetical protein
MPSAHNERFETRLKGEPILEMGLLKVRVGIVGAKVGIREPAKGLGWMGSMGDGSGDEL